jgi:hypothetical protein
VCDGCAVAAVALSVAVAPLRMVAAPQQPTACAAPEPAHGHQPGHHAGEDFFSERERRGRTPRERLRDYGRRAAQAIRLCVFVKGDARAPDYPQKP